MGLFDYVICKSKLMPKKYRNREYQTKDLDNYLGEFTIHKDNSVTYSRTCSSKDLNLGTDYSITAPPINRDIIFYDIIGDVNSDKWQWIEFHAEIRNSKLVKLSKPNITNRVKDYE